MSPVPVAAVAAVAGTRAALRIVDHVCKERTAAREANDRRDQLGHERQVRSLEQQLDRAVRRMPPGERREFERERQAIERDRGLDRER